jgi:hypothetical protein
MADPCDTLGTAADFIHAFACTSIEDTSGTPKSSEATEAAKVANAEDVVAESAMELGVAGHDVASATKTVFVSGNFEGDGKAMDVVMAKSAAVASSAVQRNDKVIYAFTGGMVPDIHAVVVNDDTCDPLVRATRAHRNGIDLPDGLRVPPDNVMLLSGTRELAWLRIASQNPETAEIMSGYVQEAKEAIATLRRPTPLHGSPCLSQFPYLLAYNKSLGLFSTTLEDSAIPVAMMLKLLAMTRITMDAPSIVPNFINGLKTNKAVDGASVAALCEFIASSDGSIEDGILRLIDGNELTPEGLGVLPAAVSLVSSVVEYARGPVSAYLRSSKLLDFVLSGQHGSILEGTSGVWITSTSASYGRMRGLLPCGIDPATMEPRLSGVPCSMSSSDWVLAINDTFHTFLVEYERGAGDMSFYDLLFALSVHSQTHSMPLNALNNNYRTPTRTCYGVAYAESMPFACLQKRIMVKRTRTPHEPDLVGVLDQWANLNTSGHNSSVCWGVFTWSLDTARDLASPPSNPPLTIVESETYATHLHDVSVLLATMLMVRVGGKTLRDRGMCGLNGIVGPPVVTLSKQTMRVIMFKHEEDDCTFVALLPEAFVSVSLDYYAYDMEAFKNRSAPMIAVEGIVALPDDAEVAMGNFMDAESDTIRQTSGLRLWRICTRTAQVENYTRRSLGCERLDHYATQSMLRSIDPHTEMCGLGNTIYHTRHTDIDPFAGLPVGLVPVPGMGSRMTIDTDTNPVHELFRIVVNT